MAGIGKVLVVDDNELIRRLADEALYAAKHAGKNKLIIAMS